MSSAIFIGGSRDGDVITVIPTQTGWTNPNDPTEQYRIETFLVGEEARRWSFMILVDSEINSALIRVFAHYCAFSQTDRAKNPMLKVVPNDPKG